MARDALDDLLDYNVIEKDVFRDVDTTMDLPSMRKASPRPEDPKDILGLGIDEEIKVTKKRKPIVKLDEDRLLSQAGIPKLRRISRERLRHKGKGHEYSDIANLLNVYQLWLDALYPRAKFADGLALIEKLGHSKRVQTMRREWINESKPRDKLEEASKQSPEPNPNHQPPKSRSLDVQQRSTTLTANASDEDEDLYSATPRKTDRRNGNHAATKESLFLSDNEDDLDALLDEDGLDEISGNSGAESHPKSDGQIEMSENEFEDEMDAMAGMTGMW